MPADDRAADDRAAEEGAADGLVEVGHIGRAHGVRGDLYIDLLTDRTERVAVGARLRVRGTWLTIETARPAGTRWLVHFAGLADRTAAEAFVNSTLLAAPLAALSDDGLYVSQLIGAAVVGADGTVFGRCVAVVANPAHDLLELEDGSLVPVVFVTSASPARVTIDPPEGLFDLRS
ncbi:MAG: ribosome maturation factor RimM [Ilumatobacteraceae bacterium]